MGVSTPPTLFSVYKDSLKSSPILWIFYVSQQKIVDFYFAVTHFLLLMSWPGYPQSPAVLDNWRQPWLYHHHQALPSPAQVACPCSQPHFQPHPTLFSWAAEWNGVPPPLSPQHQPHLPPASTPQWKRCPIPIPLWHRLLPKFPMQSSPSGGQHCRAVLITTALLPPLPSWF